MNESSEDTKEVPMPELFSIIYKSDVERQIVILPYNISDGYWQNPNIAYFRTSGTSNKNCGWLCGTFFPTGGITSKIKNNQKTVGMNDACQGTEGHLLKMSDIINEVGVFVGIEQFCLKVANMIEDIIYSPGVFKKRPKPPEFDNYMDDPKIKDLFETFYLYFISEQQLKLSYQLTPPNTGLWGWRFGNFLLSDFCKHEWDDIPHISVAPDRMIESSDACEFIKQHNASVNFDVLHNSFKRMQGRPRYACIAKVTQMENAFTAKGFYKHKRTKSKKSKKSKKTKRK